MTAESPTDLPDRMPRDDAGLKALAAQLGCAKKDLLVLSAANDPFNVDTPTKRRHAEWFADLWRDFGYSNGVHSRRVHYHASVMRAGEVMLPDGGVYLNDADCWTVLSKAAVSARDLGIIDPALFIDKRNDRSKLSAYPRLSPAEPGYSVSLPEGGWRLPYIGSDLSVWRFSTGSTDVQGYDYDPDDQPYLVELWIEKSTMDDVLVPVCRLLGVNYTPGTGFTSRTRVCEMLHRAQQHGKPVRVFIVSDYDPAGSHMPRSIARVIEYYRDQIAPEVPIALHHIGMTADWALRYDLPRAPISAAKGANAQGRIDNFEEIHGAGCVELDALQVLHPGALAEEIRAAVNAYRDQDIGAELEQVERVAGEAVAAEWHGITAEIRGQLATIRTDVNEVVGRYRERLAQLDRELQADLSSNRERLAELWAELEEAADEMDPDLPDRPRAVMPYSDESGWLYDSSRHWWDQLQHYRTEKNGGAS